jgi:hypothetical protein
MRANVVVRLPTHATNAGARAGSSSSSGSLASTRARPSSGLLVTTRSTYAGGGMRAAQPHTRCRAGSRAESIACVITPGSTA